MRRHMSNRHAIQDIVSFSEKVTGNPRNHHFPVFSINHKSRQLLKSEHSHPLLVKKKNTKSLLIPLCFFKEETNQRKEEGS